MNTEYQVGDLFCATWDENEMYVITNAKQRVSQHIYFVTCMRTYKNYVYRKESIDAMFQKVS